VWEENLLVWEAFWDLSPERQAAGFSDGVIPAGAIGDYADRRDLPWLELLRFIRRMDRAYIAFRKAEEEKRQKHAERAQRHADRARIHRGR
jgi:hypothetical protein